MKTPFRLVSVKMTGDLLSDPIECTTPNEIRSVSLKPTEQIVSADCSTLHKKLVSFQLLVYNSDKGKSYEADSEKEFEEL
jgi:hypothetical protein